MNPNPASVLAYWRAVELFLPQGLPRLDPAPRRVRRDPNQSKHVLSIEPDSKLPWEEGHWLGSLRPPHQTRAWRHTIYCGLYDLSKVRTILEQQLGHDPNSFDDRSGESCLFAFSVTEKGIPIAESFVFSSCAWAVARTLRPGPGSPEWLETFDEDSVVLNAEFRKWLSREENQARSLTYSDLKAITDHVVKQLAPTKLSEPFAARVQSVWLSRRQQSGADDQDFLNSFYLQDLRTVENAVEAGNVGEGLKNFLTPESTLPKSRRIDVRAQFAEVASVVSPSLFPRGRWPGKGHHPLVYSQQFAVNSALSTLQEAGLFAVNGPPGTGKTTLLRDLIASIVVKRAEQLAKLRSPKDAWKGNIRWGSEKAPRQVSRWNPALMGFEIVIASSNNGAVENVSMEIPGWDAVDESWLEEFEYFGDHAERLTDKKAWALMAARLGSKENRRKFVTQFWEKGFRSFLVGLCSEHERTDWKAAVAQFKKAVEQEATLRRQREDWFALRKEIEATQAAVERHEAELMRLQQAWLDLQRAQSEAVELLSTAKVQMSAALEKRNEHLKFRPGFLEVLFTAGKALREWRAESKTLKASFDEYQKEYEQRTRVLSEKQTLHRRLQDEPETKRKELQLARSKLRSAEQEQNEAKAREHLGEFFPAHESGSNNDAERELSSPWADPPWNQARARIFIEALNLHRQFIVSNPEIFLHDLQVMMETLAGSTVSLPRDAVQSIWTSLFMVIPVVSTTFASFARLFARHGPESLGWLLIDEAGQSSPQAAAGALWRSRRTVVVGDPLQLEPVVTIPFSVQQALRRHYQVEETWLPSRLWNGTEGCRGK